MGNYRLWAVFYELNGEKACKVDISDFTADRLERLFRAQVVRGRTWEYHLKINLDGKEYILYPSNNSVVGVLLRTGEKEVSNGNHL